MARYLRPRVTGATVFFTVALADRSSDLLLREIGRLREAVRATKAARPFVIDAWVVLPDHLHAVWTLPAGDRDHGLRWAAIKARFVMSLHEADGRMGRRAGFSPPSDLPTVRTGRYAGLQPRLRTAKREAAVWQRRFWEHHIRDEADYAAHLRYCWLNPVKHGLAARPADWPHSSIHRDIARGMAAPEWSGAAQAGVFGE